MKRSEVIEWLRQNGGQQGQAQVEYVEVPNPAYHPKLDPRRTVQAKKVTWTSNSGQTLSVIDSGEIERISDDTTPSLVDVNPGEPIYEVIGGGPKEEAKPPGRSPEKEREDQQLNAEKEANLKAGRGWKTDAEVKKEADELQERQNRNQINQQQANTAAGHLTVAQQNQALAAQTAGRQATNDAARLDIERGRYGLEERKANQPQILGTPTAENRQIGMFDPVSGSVKAVDNPLYDEAKVAAKQMQEDLALAIQMNKLTADQAAAQYTQWFKANVEVPFMQASEARAQAAEKRAALEAVERKRQFAATNQIQRAQVGQQAASTAIGAEMSMLPHRVGPAFGEQMSAAITSLAQGGKMDGPAASAGVNFTKDAFEYDAPDIKKIAKQATKAALKGVTPYDPGDEEIPTADYTGISMPTGGVMGGAPAQPSYIDTNAMYQNWINSRYAGPTP